MSGFCLRAKSESEGFLRKGNFDAKVKFVRHDGAKEFATNSLKAFYEDHGIEVQPTVRYAHQTNATAERANRTIRKSRSSDEDDVGRRPRTVRHRVGLEEASAPNRVNPDEEEKSGDQDDESTPPVFWLLSRRRLDLP
ncbi:Retrotransposon, partial [Phytophthora palmivora]